jgi:hypothetical protein
VATKRGLLAGRVKPVLVEVPIERLVPAPWNPKPTEDDEAVRKLIESIKEDNSAGVPVVRELEGSLFEVIDGNHRIEALRQLGWKSVTCENFGRIPKAAAILIGRRRNHQWFEMDNVAFAKLLQTDILAEVNMDDLLPIMPESKGELEDLAKSLDFDFNQFGSGGGEGGGGKDQKLPEDYRILRLTVPGDVWELWLRWKEAVEEATGEKQEDYRLFEFAMIEAIISQDLISLRKDAERQAKEEEARRARNSPSRND